MSLVVVPLLLILSFGAVVSRQSGFSSPNFVQPYGSGAFENVVVWYVGQTKQVIYDVTDVSGLDEYTVALWQQDTGAGGSATLGPVINSTILPDVRDSFSWRVQLYDFDLEKSNVFFFWLFNGTADNQGNTAFKQVSSAYFNISDQDPPAESSSTKSSAVAAQTQTASSSILTSTNTESTTTAIPLTTTTNIGSSADITKTTTTADNTATPSDSHSNTLSSTSEHGGGISTGAGVGIGVGVGVAGISAVVCALIVARSKRKKHNSIHELDPCNSFVNGGKPLRQGQNVNEGYRAVPGSQTGEPTNYGQEPIELYAPQAAGRHSPVELDAGPRGGY